MTADLGRRTHLDGLDTNIVDPDHLRLCHRKIFFRPRCTHDRVQWPVVPAIGRDRPVAGRARCCGDEYCDGPAHQRAQTPAIKNRQAQYQVVTGPAFYRDVANGGDTDDYIHSVQ